MPALARGVFAERLALAERYAGLLADDGVVRGLIGPREAPRLWDRHLLNCALLGGRCSRRTSTSATSARGAGLPGLVLAIRRPDLRVTLVEPLLRRTTFLAEVVAVAGAGERRGRAGAGRGAARARGLRRGDVPGGGAAGPAAGLVDAAGAPGRAPGRHEGVLGPGRGRRRPRRLRRTGRALVEVLDLGEGESIHPRPWFGWKRPDRPARLDAADVRRDSGSASRSRDAKGRRVTVSAPRLLCWDDRWAGVLSGLGWPDTGRPRGPAIGPLGWPSAPLYPQNPQVGPQALEARAAGRATRCFT